MCYESKFIYNINTGRGGVCILIKETIAYQRIDVTEFHKKNKCEIAAAIMDAEGQTILITACYRLSGN